MTKVRVLHLLANSGAAATVPAALEFEDTVNEERELVGAGVGSGSRGSRLGRFFSLHN